MFMSEYSILADSVREKLRIGSEALQRAQQMRLHLTRISGDASGSPLDGYLEDEDIESCRDFLVDASAHAFSNAEEIYMQRRRFTDAPVWTEPRRYANFSFRKLDRHTTWKGNAYTIGSVALGGGDSRLMLSPLCNEDGAQVGELRCFRSPRVFSTSYGYGYGRLPDLPPADLPLKLPKLNDLLLKHVI